MKINLLYTDDNKHVKGWEIIPENEDEKKVLGTIRNRYFWGLDDMFPKYAGIETKDNYVTRMLFRIPKYWSRND